MHVQILENVGNLVMMSIWGSINIKIYIIMVIILKISIIKLQEHVYWDIIHRDVFKLER